MEKKQVVGKTRNTEPAAALMRGFLTVALVLAFAVSVSGCSGKEVGSTSRPMSGARERTVESSAPAGSAASSLPSDAPAVPGEPAENPVVAPSGELLEPIEVAPPKTYKMFDLPTPFSGAEFELVARPYGWAGSPEDASARRMLVKVESVKAVSGQTDKFVDLTGQNALVWFDSGTVGSESLDEGGIYRIRVTVRPSGKRGALYATSVEQLGQE